MTIDIAVSRSAVLMTSGGDRVSTLPALILKLSGGCQLFHARNKETFDLYVEGILAPTLRPGDVVVLDNLPAHRSAEAAATLKEIGAWFLFLPKYSPDLNPIEMAFSKLKALIRKVAARTYEDLWRAVGNVCSLFTPDECYNFFVAAGYETD